MGLRVKDPGSDHRQTGKYHKAQPRLGAIGGFWSCVHKYIKNIKDCNYKDILGESPVGVKPLATATGQAFCESRFAG